MANPSSDHDGGLAALNALNDLREQRDQLDRSEIDAVRAARRAGRTWAEIAAVYNITRQSAWERWRHLEASDLDVVHGRVDRNAIEAAVRADVRRSKASLVPNSFVVLRIKAEEDYAMLAARFELTVGVMRFGLWELTGEAGEWAVGGGYRATIPSHPLDDSGWLTRGGWGGERTSSFGGLVASAEVATVRLVEPSGGVVEDRVEQGVAMFLRLVRQQGCIVQFLDSAGRLVSSSDLD
jgi:hypothetical protein